MAASPDLKPETIRTYTLVYEQYFGDHFHVAVSGYYYTIHDLIDQTTDLSGNSVFKNIDEVEARGLEWEVENRWPNGLDGRFSYTIQTTEDKRTGDPLTNSPAQLVKLNLTAPIMKDNVFAGIEELYTSRRKTLSGASAENVYITNLTIFTQNLASRLEASASIYNLFDKKYGDPVSADLLPLDTVRQDGRAYRLKVTYAF
jgi:iron complex outermembrane receptor protein